MVDQYNRGFTIEGWFYKNNWLDGNERTLLSTWSNNNLFYRLLTSSDGRLRIYYYNSNSYSNIYLTQNSGWVHIAFVVSSTRRIYVYINGSRWDTGLTFSPTTTTTYLGISSYGNQDYYGLYGYIDSIALYNYQKYSGSGFEIEESRNVINMSNILKGATLGIGGKSMDASIVNFFPFSSSA